MTPSQILEAEIHRLMRDRGCDRNTAVLCVRTINQTLANEADKESFGLVSLANIATNDAPKS